MDILQELSKKGQDVDPNTVKWPESKIEEGQTVVGTASDDAKRLWGLADLIMDQLPLIGKEHDSFCDGNCAALSENDQKRHRILMDKAAAIKAEHELVMELFWATVRREFPEIARKQRIGIGLDGQVYWEKSRRGTMVDIMMLGPDGPMSMPTDLADLFGIRG